jgi:hypothetical protein
MLCIANLPLLNLSFPAKSIANGWSLPYETVAEAASAVASGECDDRPEDTAEAVAVPEGRRDAVAEGDAKGECETVIAGELPKPAWYVAVVSGRFVLPALFPAKRRG